MIAWLLVGLAGWLGINVAFLALALLGTSNRIRAAGPILCNGFSWRTCSARAIPVLRELKVLGFLPARPTVPTNAPRRDFCSPDSAAACGTLLTGTDHIIVRVVFFISAVQFGRQFLRQLTFSWKLLPLRLAPHSQRPFRPMLGC